jgi:hypothetical protein
MKGHRQFSPCEMHLPQVVEGKRLLLAFAASASRIRLWGRLPIFVQLQGGYETEKYPTISPMCAMDSTGRVRKGRRIAPVRDFIGI